MDFQSLLDKHKPFFLKHWLPISLASLGLIFFSYGLISLIGSSASRENIVFEAGTSSPDEAQKEIVADIEGSVARPGVYKLNSGSRIQDILIAAGGLGANADRNWVSRNINLAQKLIDGAKVYVPAAGEKGDMGGIKSIRSIKGTSSTIDPEGLVNINTSSESELDSLPGIGPATAQKIIGSRPYNSIEELVEKKVVSSSVFEKIKDKITN